MDFTLANFFGVMSILIGFICLLLSCFLLAVPSPRRRPNELLAIFLFLTALELSVWLWGTKATLDGPVGIAWTAISRLQMPVFFFFFTATCYSDFRFKLHDVYHLVPSVLVVIFSLPNAASPFLVLAPISEAFRIGGSFYWFVSQILYFAYIAAIISVLARFSHGFRLQHAGGHSEVLLWLIQLTAASLFARAIILARDALSLTSANTVVIVLQIAGALFALAITTWIALKSLLQPQIFRDVDRRFLNLTAKKPEDTNADLKRLLQYVDGEQSYLDPDLNLANLADKVAMTPRELSELLNQSLGVHFFDFINNHRIQYAQKCLLNDPKRSILEILYESGFNSKSSFNTAFKKHTGMTPSAYRSSQQNG
ncbi:MAG: helix-turn-helix domain-containing protein [Pseudomonadota bacterium]